MPAEKITKAGVYALTMDSYHSQCCVGPSFSSSNLRQIILQSPAHFFEDSSLNPELDQDDDDEDKKKESAAFVLGRAAHHLLLGEDAFSTSFVMRPDKVGNEAWHGNKTVCKDWLARQTNAGRTVLRESQIKVIRRMANSLHAHPLIRAGILNGQVEQSLIWQDDDTGLWLKARPDAIPNDSGDGADLKTTSSLGFDLDRDIFTKYRYDIQAALVGIGMRKVLKRPMDTFSFVFVGSKPPCCVDVLTLHQEDIIEAEKDLRIALRTAAHCLKTGDWFGPSGNQSDARWAHKSDWAKQNGVLRREFLEREIKKREIEE